MKYKRTWVEIDVPSFNHNITQYKTVIGNNHLAIVIKANAYGHDIGHIAQLADDNKSVDILCVATVSDALYLRRLSIKKPILILSTIFDEDPELLIHQNVSCSIYDIEMAKSLNNIGKKYHFKFPIHLKIDTGLSRLGIDVKVALATIQEILRYPYLYLEGIYSHFAESHKQDQSFTQQQVHQFSSVLAALAKNNISIPYIHLANSAGTTSLDLPFCNLFRVGTGTYGLWPSNENQLITQIRFPFFNLKPIATWKTHIFSIKTVKKGNFIGYDRTLQATHDMRIATIPIGYYDGYDFRLFNKASVIVRNQYAPVVGRISMNMCTIDITSIADACIGDQVILMGPHVNIHPAQLGLLAGNPNVREITTKINAIIPRIVTTSSSQHKTDVPEKNYYTSPSIE
jgi:alanine racemase